MAEHQFHPQDKESEYSQEKFDYIIQDDTTDIQIFGGDQEPFEEEEVKASPPQKKIQKNFRVNTKKGSIPRNF